MFMVFLIFILPVLLVLMSITFLVVIVIIFLIVVVRFLVELIWTVSSNILLPTSNTPSLCSSLKSKYYSIFDDLAHVFKFHRKF